MYTKFFIILKGILEFGTNKTYGTEILYNFLNEK